MKILLAGGNGFIGSYLYTQLKINAIITSIDRYISSSDDKSIKVNLVDERNVNDFVENSDNNFDVLIFLVGLAHAKGKGKDFGEFEKVNYYTLKNLLSALESAGKMPEKIIFASTISVYGEKYHQATYSEETEVGPFSPYALTKLKAEQFLLDKYENKSWVLRFAPVYSPEFLLNINRRTKIGRKYYRVGKGDKKLSLCNIENISTAISGIVDGEVPVGIYNISDPIDYTYSDLLFKQGVSFVFRIPVVSVKLLYFFGRITKNIFLKENCTKLITDNTFPSNKIQKFIKLNSTICDLKRSND